MTTLPVADAARMLGIHPKTLHHWLKQAKLPLAAHPTDARIKCVMWEHIQQLAMLHDRPLQSPATTSALPSQEPAPRPPENETEPPRTAHTLPASFPQEAALLQKLFCLEAKIATLQEQVAQLALALLLERERSVEHRITALEALMQQLMGGHIPDPLVTSDQSEPLARRSSRQLLPSEQLARSRMPPLIEYSASGTYVIVSSQEGELHLEPDSAAWFDWLTSITSFRFVGPQGRFTACRDSKQGRGWIAHRSVHQRRYKRYIGVTERLSVDTLERTAATRLDSSSFAFSC